MSVLRSIVRQARAELEDLALERDPLLAELDRATPDAERLNTQLRTALGIAAATDLLREQLGVGRVMSDLRNRLLELDKRASQVIAETGFSYRSRRDAQSLREEKDQALRELWATYHGQAAAHPRYRRP